MAAISEVCIAAITNSLADQPVQLLNGGNEDEDCAAGGHQRPQRQHNHCSQPLPPQPSRNDFAPHELPSSHTDNLDLAGKPDKQTHDMSLRSGSWAWNEHEQYSHYGPSTGIHPYVPYQFRPVGDYTSPYTSFDHHPSNAKTGNSVALTRMYGMHSHERRFSTNTRGLPITDDNRVFKRQRRNLPKEATDMLTRWYRNHPAHPYPTDHEKIELCKRTGLTKKQIDNWFINARRRRLPVAPSLGTVS